MMEKTQYSSTISKEELNSLPGGGFSGTIYMISSLDDFEQVRDKFTGAVKVWGFDTETRPTFKKGQVNKVALLQLSTENEAFLFRTCLMPLPKPVIDLLSTAKIKKVGVAIKDDIVSLQKLNFFVPGGFVDLQNLASDYGIEDKSLKKLAAITLDIRISKRQQVSNWESNVLTESQLQYAATDAWACLEIYKSWVGGDKAH